MNLSHALRTTLRTREPKHGVRTRFATLALARDRAGPPAYKMRQEEPKGGAPANHALNRVLVATHAPLACRLSRGRRDDTLALPRAARSADDAIAKNDLASW